MKSLLRKLRRAPADSQESSERMSSPGPTSSSNVSPSNTEVLIDPEEGNYLILTKEECVFILGSWNRALNTTDVGAELVVRLLNDKRSLFKSLLETQVGVLETEKFTVDIINRDCQRAKQVGEGVVRFFNKAFEHLCAYNASSEIRQMSYDLGSLHYRMRVWFQAENWLCVKNSLLEVILEVGNKHTTSGLGRIARCVSDSADFSMPDKESQRRAWTKVVQFVIRNMKRGFLAEALKNERSTDDADSSSSNPSPKSIE